MLDPKLLREKADFVKEKLKKRGAEVKDVDQFLKIDKNWRQKTHLLEELKGEKNKISGEVGAAKRKGEDVKKFLKESKDLEDKVENLRLEVDEIEKKLKNLALLMPNLPEDDVYDGIEPAEIRKGGVVKEFEFAVRGHHEIGEKLGILNFKQAAKISGSRFVVYHGAGAELERALITFMLDVQTKKRGYAEVLAPYLVLSECLQGTGQLPKFKEDVFECQDNLYLIPTAEVSITNLHRSEILDGDILPLKYASYSACFRREAGSYGKDVRGILRQHQFNKVELVKFCKPEEASFELEKLVEDAEVILQKLGLPYRVVMLGAKDLGFASAKTYDLEIWFPSEGKYREVSSCSNFKDFQARRANIKFRREKKAKPEFVHTLNGSGLAVGRTLAAILENYQLPDGRVEVPKVLRKYLDREVIE
jgi:seryl-tRNA synthetase